MRRDSEIKEFQNLDWGKILQTLKPYFKVKYFTFVFLITSASLLLMKILSLSIILDNMYTMIFYVWILSIIGLAYKGYSWLWDKAQSRIEKSRAEHLAVIEASRQEEEYLHCLRNLSDDEIAVMKYVLGQKTGAVWLPIENATVLSLYSKKCLLPISNINSLRGSVYGVNAYCWAYCVPDRIANCLSVHQEVINKIWKAIPQTEAMIVYQQKIQ